MSRTVAKYGLQPDTVISQSGKGYFFGFSVLPPQSSGTDIFSPANTIRMWQFILPIQVTVSKVTVEVTTLSAATAADVGIYDQNGNRLAFTNGGINTTATGVKSQVALSGGAVTLLPGVYWFASTCNSGTPAARAILISGGSGNMLGDSNVARAILSATGSSSGVLPATAAVTGGTPITGVQVPMALFEP